MSPHDKKWYKLDNAAKLYPAIRNRRWTAMFRVSAKLNETVDKALLQKALDITLPRMGIFSCHLKTGLFWYYFEKNKKQAKVMDDAINPCIRLYTKDSDGYLFRIRSHGKSIALEVFHSVSDGYGGLTFLKTLLAQYFTLKGSEIPVSHGVLNCDEAPTSEEMRDGFLSCYNSKSVRAWKENRAYQVSGTQKGGHELSVITGIVSAKKLKALSKEYKVSITEFLVGAYMYCLYQNQLSDNPRKIRPIIVSVPVNLRAFFDCKTLRNFSSYINPEINANWGEYSFEEILHVVHHDLRSGLTKKALRSKVSKNVKAEKSIFVRMLPLFMKNFLISFVYSLAGEKRTTSVMSNLGVIEVPRQMAEHIDRFDVMLGALRHNKISCAVCSFGDKLSVCFTSTMKETHVEKEFFTFLVKKGIHVKLETNRE